MAFELSEQVERRLTGDEVAWLTTVTPGGKPAPRPVWFVWDGTAIVIYSMNGAARLRYIEHNPQVTVHFNSVGTLIEQLGETPEWYDDNYGVALRIVPERSWGFA
jgi:general stress protein 26